jgi:hypothetical protein
MRTTLTKSLHTVTAVSRLAVHLHATRTNGPKRSAALVQQALQILGQAGAWAEDDPTLVACIDATHRGIEAWRTQQQKPTLNMSSRTGSVARTAAAMPSKVTTSTSAQAPQARR